MSARDLFGVFFPTEISTFVFVFFNVFCHNHWPQSLDEGEDIMEGLSTNIYSCCYCYHVPTLTAVVIAISHIQ